MSCSPTRPPASWPSRAPSRRTAQDRRTQRGPIPAACARICSGHDRGDSPDRGRRRGPAPGGRPAQGARRAGGPADARLEHRCPAAGRGLGQIVLALPPGVRGTARGRPGSTGGPCARIRSAARWAAGPGDPVLVHDAARPLLTAGLAEAAIAALLADELAAQAAIVAAPGDRHGQAGRGGGRPRDARPVACCGPCRRPRSSGGPPSSERSTWTSRRSRWPRTTPGSSSGPADGCWSWRAHGRTSRSRPGSTCARRACSLPPAAARRS